MRKCIKAVCVLLLVMGACKKDRIEQPTPGSGHHILDLVPAESPFVMAMVTPMPDEMIERVAGWVAPIAGWLQEQITEHKATETDPVGRAILAELDGKLSRAGMESLGISVRSRMAVYAIGLSLAMRVELADGKRLRAAIERVEKASGKKAPRGSFDGVEYWSASEDEVLFVFAIVGNEAVGGVMHEKARDRVLPLLFGRERPEQSIRGTIQEALAQHKMLGMSTVYIDMAGLARAFTGELTPLARDTLALSGVDLPELSGECRTEIRQLGALMPRMVFDYTGVKGSELDSLGVIELRPDIAKELVQVLAPTLDLASLTAGKPLMSLGLGVDMDSVFAYLLRKAGDVAMQPYRCEHLTWLNEGLAAAGDALRSGEVPGFLTGLRGGAMVLADLQMQGGEPVGGKGWAAVAARSTKPIRDEIASNLPLPLDLTPKQAATTLPVGLPGLPSVDIVSRDAWLGVAAGAGMTDALLKLVEAGPPRQGPFAVLAYDYGVLMEKTGVFDSMGGAEALIVGSMLNAMGLVRMEMHATERGLVFSSSISMQ